MLILQTNMAVGEWLASGLCGCDLFGFCWVSLVCRDYACAAASLGGETSVASVDSIGTGSRRRAGWEGAEESTVNEERP